MRKYRDSEAIENSRSSGVWSSIRETSIALLSYRKRGQGYDSFYLNSAYLVVNSLSSYLLGFLFWVVVARFYAVGDLGIGSALTSAGALLSFVATLGLGSGLVRFLPSAKTNRVRLINACYTVTCLTAFAVAVVFLAGIPLWSPSLGLARGNLFSSIAFIVFVVAGTLLSLLSDTYVSLRRAEFSLTQGLIMGILKLVLVVALANLFGALGIIVSWTIATTVAVLTGMSLFLRRLEPGYRPIPSFQRQVSNEMVHFSFANYVSLGLWSIPGWVLPILVVSRLGTEANGYFFVAWAMCGALFAIPTAISTSLFAEGSNQDKWLGYSIKRSLIMTAWTVLPAAALFFAIGDKLLLVFGQGYSHEGEKLLWIMAPSALPLSINMVYLAVARVRKSLKTVIALAAGIAVGTLGISYILIPHLGIQAPAIGWLVSQSVVAIIVLPGLIKELKRSRMRDK